MTSRAITGGLVAIMVDPRGIETDYSYNTHGLLRQVVYAKGTSDQASVSYTYDQNDNPASFTNEIGATTLTTYDHLDRLVEQQDPRPRPQSAERAADDHLAIRRGAAKRGQLGQLNGTGPNTGS